MYKVLFVCTGNICRSPSAEAVFRHRVEVAGLAHAIACDSVGTHGYHIGETPDPRSVAAALRRGVDMSRLRARKLHPDDYAEYDLMLAMDGGHLRLMEMGNKGAGKAQLAMLLAHAGVAHTQDVPDPYYSNAQAFEQVLDLVEEASDALIARICKEQGL